MNALVVDDHKINYVLVRSLLNEYFPEFKTVHSAESVKRAIQMLDEKSYDLIFLDMKLGDGEGFDVLRQVSDVQHVIVISSHRDYAVEAFKHPVIDYLVKPIKTSEFREAVKKALETKSSLTAERKGASAPEALAGVQSQKIFVNYRNDYIALDKTDIQYIKALGKYSEIHTEGGKVYVSSKNLKEFEEVLAGNMLRVHNSYLVSITSIVSFSKEDSTLKLRSGVAVPVSVRKREELSKAFRIF